MTINTVRMMTNVLWYLFSFRLVYDSFSALSDEVLYDYNRSCYQVKERYGNRNTNERAILFCAWISELWIDENNNSRYNNINSKKNDSSKENESVKSIVNKLRISLDLELESERAMNMVKKRNEKVDRKNESKNESKNENYGNKVDIVEDMILQERAELAAELLCIR